MTFTDPSIPQLPEGLDTIPYTILLAYDSLPSLANNVNIAYEFDSFLTPTSYTGCVYSPISALIQGDVTPSICSAHGGSVVTLSANGQAVTGLIPVITASQVFQATLYATVSQSVAAGQTLSNTYDITYTSAADSSFGPVYSLTGSVDTTVNIPSVSYQILSTSDASISNPSLTIEEIGTIQVSVTMPVSTTPTSVVIQLPPNTLLSNASLISIGSNIHDALIEPASILSFQSPNFFQSTINGLPSFTFNFGTIETTADSAATDAGAIVVSEIIASVS